MHPVAPSTSAATPAAIRRRGTVPASFISFIWRSSPRTNDPGASGPTTREQPWKIQATSDHVSRRYSSFVNARPTAAKPTKNNRGNAQTSGYANPGAAKPATDTGASALTGCGVDCVTVVVVDVDVEGNVPRPEPPVNVPPPEPG